LAEKVPAGHVWHARFWLGRHGRASPWPGAQGVQFWHAVATSAVWNVPAPHASHANGLRAKKPGPQPEQMPSAVALQPDVQTLPLAQATQALQVVWPAMLWNRPASHPSHAVWPTAGWAEPAGHSWHWLIPTPP